MRFQIRRQRQQCIKFKNSITMEKICQMENHEPKQKLTIITCRESSREQILLAYELFNYNVSQS